MLQSTDELIFKN